MQRSGKPISICGCKISNIISNYQIILRFSFKKFVILAIKPYLCTR